METTGQIHQIAIAENTHPARCLYISKVIPLTVLSPQTPVTQLAT
jgi:hypothetical protein